MLAAAITLLLLGDSITAGIVSTPSGPSYAELLEDSFALEVTIAACGGSKSTDWVIEAPQPKRSCGGPANLYVDSALPLLPADIATVLLGSNDSLDGFGQVTTPAAIYRASIESLAQRLLADGAGVVMLMTPPPSPSQPSLEARLAEYRDAVIEVCSVPGDAIHCGPNLHDLMGSEHFQPFDLHPNRFGSRLIADELIRSILPEPPGSTLSLVALGALGAISAMATAGRRREAMPRNSGYSVSEPDRRHERRAA